MGVCVCSHRHSEGRETSDAQLSVDTSVSAGEVDMHTFNYKAKDLNSYLVLTCGVFISVFITVELNRNIGRAISTPQGELDRNIYLSLSL